MSTSSEILKILSLFREKSPLDKEWSRDLLTRIEGEAHANGLKYKLLFAERNKRAHVLAYRGPDWPAQGSPENIESAAYCVVLNSQKNRDYSDRAWNRIDKKDRDQLLKYSNGGVKCFVVQLWHG